MISTLHLLYAIVVSVTLTKTCVTCRDMSDNVMVAYVKHQYLLMSRSKHKIWSKSEGKVSASLCILSYSTTKLQ